MANAMNKSPIQYNNMDVGQMIRALSLDEIGNVSGGVPSIDGSGPTPCGCVPCKTPTPKLFIQPEGKLT